MNVLIYIVAIILFIVWVVAGGFITQSNVFLHPYRYDDTYMHLAWLLTFWVSFITWVLLILMIVLVILAIAGVGALFGTGAGEAAQAEKLATGDEPQLPQTPQIGTIVIVMLVIFLGLVIFNGISSIVASINIKKSPSYSSENPKLKKAYDSCIIAAVMSMVSAGLLLIGLIALSVVKSSQAKKNKIIQEQNAQMVLQEKQVVGGFLLDQLSK
jgi:hypothetical protein